MFDDKIVLEKLCQSLSRVLFSCLNTVHSEMLKFDFTFGVEDFFNDIDNLISQQGSRFLDNLLIPFSISALSFAEWTALRQLNYELSY